MRIRKTVRIAHFGYGALGRQIVADLRKRAYVEVVAIVDPAVDEVLDSADDIEDWSAIDCCVVTTHSSMAQCMPLLRQLLARGQTIVSTCEELSWPWSDNIALGLELDDLAKAHEARLLGTGVNPGFLMDSFPLTVARAARRVDAIHVHRIQDATTRRLPFRQKIGAGLSDEAFEAKVADGSLRHVGLSESLHFLAHGLGLIFDDQTESLAPVRDDDGAITGVRQEARATLEGRCIIELVFVAAVGQRDPHDRVYILGDPNLEATFTGGVHGDIATSALTMNMIRPLLFAAPGLHTMMSVPLSGLKPL